ncbi:MAG: uracil-DNA glycosylase [Pelosinus sp.]|nr:uracil-DNA glycosylase [Pelosinus sp.]
MPEKPTVNCMKCKFFYITWDKFFPYGCKAMRFKSKNMPYIEVAQISGQPCLDYQNKQAEVLK